MAVPARQPTLADFLIWEAAQPERHEFHRGGFFARVGGRRIHGLVTGNLYAALRSSLADSPCRAFFESMQLQVADEAVFYPDLFVTCDPADLKTDRVFRAPTLVVEVLSESTQAYDRGLKFVAYRQLASLREYVLIDPDTRRVEVFRRNERELFELHDQTGRADMHLASVDVTLPMGLLFEGLEDSPDASPDFGLQAGAPKP
jgi:Uma2 family endonuclease